MGNKGWGIIIAGVLLIAASVMLWRWHERARVKPANLSIYFSGDTRGRLVPCGCFTGQFGGLTRLKTRLQEGSSDFDVRVDVGDALGGNEDYQRLQYLYILKAYSSMNFDAMNMGHRESQLTADQLKNIQSNSPVTLLSANLVEDQTGKRIFAPFKVIERGRHKIGIVGVLDSKMAENLGAGVRIEPMEQALEEVLPQLRQKVDLLILLAFTDEAGLARLARQFYELNVILGGKVSQPSQRMLKENRSVILYTANESRTVGILKGQMNPRFTAQSFEMFMLHDKIREDPTILEMADQYRQEIRTTRLDIDELKRLEADMVPGVKNRASYTGSEACFACHKEEATIWKSSGHSRAFSSLEGKRADADPSCIGCHVIGFGTGTGYRREFHGGKMVNVGCESCHGPGSLHVAQRQEGGKVEFKYRPLGAGDCQKCHFGEFSRPFDWEPFWAKIQHGKKM